MSKLEEKERTWARRGPKERQPTDERNAESHGSPERRPLQRPRILQRKTLPSEKIPSFREKSLPSQPLASISARATAAQTDAEALPLRLDSLAAYLRFFSTSSSETPSCTGRSWKTKGRKGGCSAPPSEEGRSAQPNEEAEGKPRFAVRERRAEQNTPSKPRA